MWLLLTTLLLLLQVPFSSCGKHLKSELKCYTSYQEVSMEEDVIDNATITTHTSYGFCVTMRKYNGTHKVAERGFWPADHLPLECHYYKAHCFPLKSEHWEIRGCCCYEDLCNANDDALFMLYPGSVNPSWAFGLVTLLRGLLLFVASQTIPVWVTILCTIVFHWILKRLNKEVPERDWDNTMEQTGLLATRDTDNVTEALASNPISNKQTERSKRLPKAKKTASRVLQTPKNDSRPLPTTNVESPCRQLRAQASKDKLVKTARGQKDEYGLDKTMVDQSNSLNPQEEATQPSAKKTRSPIKGIQQAKPPEIVLPNGRVQKVSMNFEEGDEEWENV